MGTFVYLLLFLLSCKLCLWVFLTFLVKFGDYYEVIFLLTYCSISFSLFCEMWKTLLQHIAIYANGVLFLLFFSFLKGCRIWFIRLNPNSKLKFKTEFWIRLKPNLKFSSVSIRIYTNSVRFEVSKKSNWLNRTEISPVEVLWLWLRMNLTITIFVVIVNWSFKTGFWLMGSSIFFIL